MKAKYKIWYIFFQLLFLYSCKYNKQSINQDSPESGFTRDGIYSVSYDPVNGKIYAANGNGHLFIFDTSLHLLRQLNLGEGVATALLNPAGDLIPVSLGNGSVHVLRSDSHQVTNIWDSLIHTGQAITTLFSPQSRFLLSSGSDSVIRVLSTGDWRPVRQIRDSCGVPRFFWFDGSETDFYWVNSAGYLGKYENTPGTKMVRIADAGLNCIQLDDRNLYLAGDDSNIYIVSKSKPNEYHSFLAHTGAVYVVMKYARSDSLISCGADGKIKIWSRADSGYQLALSVLAHPAPVCALYKDNHICISGGQDGWIRIWEAETLKLIREVNTAGL